ncbi:hypothetical protein CTheo_7891 [Ceratobasidium theobromae]|uniref:Uncharacterized protein n=1 Tax=Ceratobasidium theobromae TaxID=1582974 RepID=A0A5N5QAG7_9AGAM|nr:hypothetical protein CTheo_7891 [Ceratobasidium theobromae]
MDLILVVLGIGIGDAQHPIRAPGVAPVAGSKCDRSYASIIQTRIRARSNGIRSEAGQVVPGLGRVSQPHQNIPAEFFTVRSFSSSISSLTSIESTPMPEDFTLDVDRIGDISNQIRKALHKALPTPPEQFLTIMVPGKVVNFEDYAIDQANNALLPTKIELNNAILCDDMPTLSTIQMGPTGRSVARSYASAISKLVSAGKAGTTVGIDRGDEKSEDQQRYEQGMAILSAKLLDRPGTPSLVELYAEKQAKYTQTVENKAKAFEEALKRAKEDPRNKTAGQVRDAYDKWVESNARTYRNYVQAAYMDWVITGRKEEVEYWFSVVDQDSALARVERSKEVMRWAVVQDSDGSCEYQKVKLEPSDWANKCIDKMRSRTNQTKSADWYSFEIARLEKTITMLELVKSKPPKLSSREQTEIDTDLAAAKTALKTAMDEFLEAQKAHRDIAAGKYPADADTPQKKKEAKQAAVQNMQAKQQVLTEKEGAVDKLCLESYANKLKNQTNDLFDSAGTFVDKEIERNKALLKEYEDKRKALTDSESSDTAVENMGENLGISKARKDQPQANADPSKAPPPTDPFTAITVKVSSSSETKKSESTSWGFSAGVSASYGLFSVAASASHSESHSKASNELANSEVSVTFECMRVDINRPWLRPELFYDHELIPASGVAISPGASRLRDLMTSPNPSTQHEMEMYTMFAMYPVAFLVACNVVLEVSGSTSSLQAYMNDSSTSASMSIGYGPFSAHGSANHSKSDAGSACKATAAGCRIEIKAPQIIGWVSQMLPALPRIK